MIDRFVELLEDATNKLYEAAQIYVAAIDVNPDLKQEFKNRCPEIGQSVWIGFEQFGRGLIDRRLVWGGGKCQSALRKLPLPVQQLALDGPVKVFNPHSGDSEQLRVECLTAAQRKQVIGNNGIRSVHSQRKFIANEQRKRRERKAKEQDILVEAEVVEEDGDWFVQDGCIHLGEYILSREDLEAMIMQLHIEVDLGGDTSES